MRQDKYLLWLLNIEGIGNRKISKLLESFREPKEIWYASRQMLQAVGNLTEQNIKKILESKDENFINHCQDELVKKQIKFVSLFSEEYPQMLKNIYDPPIGLYVIGEIPNDRLTKVSIVGSRRCSEYGLSVAYKISKDLAENEVVIVSGMAKGIDGMAHKGAVDVGGLTIAVLGCGVDICYPSENRLLREKIIKNGCVVSEYPPGTTPIPQNFPARNRIISGLSKAVVVVEAAEKSGTLITVDQALEQGRDVYAIPGNVTSKLSAGTNNLIKQGAELVSNYIDVLNLLGIDCKKNKLGKNVNKNINTLAPEEKLIYDCISFDPISVDNIIMKTNSQIQTVQYILTLLELKGYIKKLPGQRYVYS